VSNSPHLSLRRAAAYVAAALWAVQALIWLFAPKVQDHSPPYHITNIRLFVLFWLSIAGAVAFSALASAGMQSVSGPQPSRRLRAGAVLNKITLGLSGVATLAIALAPIPALQSAALTIMTNGLYLATLTLAASLTCYALAGRRGDRGQRTMNRLTWVVAVMTVLTIVAILASGTAATLGLYLAVAVVIMDGVAWCLWGTALAARTTDRISGLPVPAGRRWKES
jgi:hypothetical protein